jgi:four helix bundle protein
VRVIALADRLVDQRRFAIADQLVRSSLSVASNMAEGEGRRGERDRQRFLFLARGSLYELETQVEVLLRAGLANDVADLVKSMARINAGITKMIKYRAITA